MKVRRSLLQETVTVATREGEGAYGPIDADARLVQCAIDETRRLVRDGNGDETTSEATLQLHPRSHVVNAEGDVVDIVDPLVVFTPESALTIGGRASRVLAAKEHRVRSSVVWVEVTCA
ncbi:hypothetical protein [Nocardioides zeae]